MFLKKRVYLFFILLSLILGIVIVINYILDPFQVLHKTEPKFINNPRIQNAGLINNYLNSNEGYDSVIIGNSLSMGFNNKETAHYLGWNKVLKLSAAGSFPYTQKITLSYALETKKVKNVLWVCPIINYQFNEDALGQFEKNFSSYVYLYDNNPFNEINYLLNLGIFQKSLSLIMKKDLHRKSMDRQNFGYVRNYKWDKWSSNENIKKLYAKYGKVLKSTFKYEDTLDINGYLNSSSLDNNLIKIIKEHPEVSFTLIIPPYSYFLTYSVYKEQLAGIKLLLERTNNLNNLKIYGFSNEDFIKNQYYYRDKRHYASEITTYLLHLIKEGRAPLTLKNLNQYHHEIIYNLNSYKEIYAKNTHIYSNYVEIKERKSYIEFILHPREKNVKVSFSLYQEKKFIAKQNYQKEFSYKLVKKDYEPGKYRVRYSIVSDKIKEIKKDTYSEVGYSNYIVLER